MFSIVISLYNKAHTIERTLGSVLAQSYGEFEVIIVNDGSTDKGKEVIAHFTSDPRIRILDQVNQGVSAARNKGVANAIYPYVAFLDGDDEWKPDYLRKMKEAIELFPEAGMYGSSSIHQNFVTREGSDSTLQRFKGSIQKVDYFQNPHTMPHTSATIVSKAIFNQIDKNGEGFPVGMKVCEDWSCFYRMAFLAPVVYVGFPLGIRNNNVEGQVTGLNMDERFKLLKFVVNFYNLTYSSWHKSSPRSENFIVFMKYDIRARIITCLRGNDDRTIQYILSHVHAEIQQQFSRLEWWLYQQQSLKPVATLYIYLTKLIWRRRGYPIVGK
jgi:glycosyltransferase involved in cell wall biosynthesis